MTISSWSSEDNLDKEEFELLISESKLDAKANVELSVFDEIEIKISDRYNVT